MEYNIYRLKGNKRPVSWQLPLKEVFVKKFVEEEGKRKYKGQKRVKFVPGADTIFAEDIKGDLQAETIWFEYGELKVRKDDILKVKLVESHPWFNKRYTLWSAEGEDKAKLEELRFKGEARKLIDDSPLEKIRAIALAVFGHVAITFSEDKCELELRKYADEKPKKLQEVMSEPDYESKLIAGQAFSYDIVKENESKTAILWADTDGEIIKLAKGEKGITELGRFLSKSTEESTNVLQSIGERVTGKLTATDPTNKDDVLDAKDREIAELKAMLEKQSGSTDEALEEATKEYEALYDNTVPPNMKNKIDWINKKIAEKKA